MGRNILREAIIDFIFQDTSLMDHLFLGIPIYSKTEIIIRYLSFILLTSISWIIFRPENLGCVVVIFLSYFINWFFNGHGYQLFYEAISMKYSARKAINYILKLKKESEKKGLHVMIYGSWSYGGAAESSDIDIFIVSVNDYFSLKSLRLGLISLKYRLLALLTPLSVDIYVVDRVDYLNWRSKAKPKEKPIILNDPTGTIKGIYRERETELEEFLNALTKIYKA